MTNERNIQPAYLYELCRQIDGTGPIETLSARLLFRYYTAKLTLTEEFRAGLNIQLTERSCPADECDEDCKEAWKTVLESGYGILLSEKHANDLIMSFLLLLEESEVEVACETCRIYFNS